MAGQSRLDRTYAHLMSAHPYGWALYKKVTNRDIFPGSYGYFDADGDWRMLLDLNKHAELVNQGWTVPKDGLANTLPPESMTWGPKVAGSIVAKSVVGTAGSAIAAAPVKAAVFMKVKSEGNYGAVLATESPVLQYSIGDGQRAHEWMIENEDQMLSKHGHIMKQHGIWVITKAYCTRRCAIALTTESKSSVQISFEADAQGMLKLTPTSSWESTTGSNCTELHEDENNGVVVFISGIHVSRRFLGQSWALDQTSQKKKIFRGDEDEETGQTQLDVTYYPPLHSSSVDLSDSGSDDGVQKDDV
ncbi:hypothetical protein VPNG_09067 [Cytospora leucostoma]|uniref:Uncharacterized protein n=1 Tax=Cytospora leucostoma TaxID=1230097 RepID=A0A423VZA6_9PEZI|nr:hypothetical protein VPNG_09067 [Cytospora leucostoma]